MSYYQQYGYFYGQQNAGRWQVEMAVRSQAQGPGVASSSGPGSGQNDLPGYHNPSNVLYNQQYQHQQIVQQPLAISSSFHGQPQGQVTYSQTQPYPKHPHPQHAQNPEHIRPQHPHPQPLQLQHQQPQHQSSSTPAILGNIQGHVPAYTCIPGLPLGGQSSALLKSPTSSQTSTTTADRKSKQNLSKKTMPIVGQHKSFQKKVSSPQEETGGIQWSYCDLCLVEIKGKTEEAYRQHCAGKLHMKKMIDKMVQEKKTKSKTEDQAQENPEKQTKRLGIKMQTKNVEDIQMDNSRTIRMEPISEPYVTVDYCKICKLNPQELDLPNKIQHGFGTCPEYMTGEPFAKLRLHLESELHAQNYYMHVVEHVVEPVKISLKNQILSDCHFIAVRESSFVCEICQRLLFKKNSYVYHLTAKNHWKQTKSWFLNYNLKVQRERNTPLEKKRQKKESNNKRNEVYDARRENPWAVSSQNPDSQMVKSVDLLQHQQSGNWIPEQHNLHQQNQHRLHLLEEQQKFEESIASPHDNMDSNIVSTAMGVDQNRYDLPGRSPPYARSWSQGRSYDDDDVGKRRSSSYDSQADRNRVEVRRENMRHSELSNRDSVVDPEFRGQSRGSDHRERNLSYDKQTSRGRSRESTRGNMPRNRWSNKVEADQDFRGVYSRSRSPETYPGKQISSRNRSLSPERVAAKTSDVDSDSELQFRKWYLHHFISQFVGTVSRSMVLWSSFQEFRQEFIKYNAAYPRVDYENYCILYSEGYFDDYYTQLCSRQGKTFHRIKPKGAFDATEKKDIGTRASKSAFPAYGETFRRYRRSFPDVTYLTYCDLYRRKHDLEPPDELRDEKPSLEKSPVREGTRSKRKTERENAKSPGSNTPGSHRSGSKASRSKSPGSKSSGTKSYPKLNEKYVSFRKDNPNITFDKYCSLYREMHSVDPQEEIDRRMRKRDGRGSRENKRYVLSDDSEDSAEETERHQRKSYEQYSSLHRERFSTDPAQKRILTERMDRHPCMNEDYTTFKKRLPDIGFNAYCFMYWEKYQKEPPNDCGRSRDSHSEWTKARETVVRREPVKAQEKASDFYPLYLETYEDYLVRFPGTEYESYHELYREVHHTRYQEKMRREEEPLNVICPRLNEDYHTFRKGFPEINFEKYCSMYREKHKMEPPEGKTSIYSQSEPAKKIIEVSDKFPLYREAYEDYTLRFPGTDYDTYYKLYRKVHLTRYQERVKREENSKVIFPRLNEEYHTFRKGFPEITFEKYRSMYREKHKMEPPETKTLRDSQSEPTRNHAMESDHFPLYRETHEDYILRFPGTDYDTYYKLYREVHHTRYQERVRQEEEDSKVIYPRQNEDYHTFRKGFPEITFEKYCSMYREKHKMEPPEGEIIRDNKFEPTQNSSAVTDHFPLYRETYEDYILRFPGTDYDTYYEMYREVHHTRYQDRVRQEEESKVIYPRLNEEYHTFRKGFPEITFEKYRSMYREKHKMEPPEGEIRRDSQSESTKNSPAVTDHFPLYRETYEDYFLRFPGTDYDTYYEMYREVHNTLYQDGMKWEEESEVIYPRLNEEYHTFRKGFSEITFEKYCSLYREKHNMEPPEGEILRDSQSEPATIPVVVSDHLPQDSRFPLYRETYEDYILRFPGTDYHTYYELYAEVHSTCYQKRVKKEEKARIIYPCLNEDYLTYKKGFPDITFDRYQTLYREKHQREPPEEQNDSDCYPFPHETFKRYRRRFPETNYKTYLHLYGKSRKIEKSREKKHMEIPGEGDAYEGDIRSASGNIADHPQESVEEKNCYPLYRETFDDYLLRHPQASHAMYNDLYIEAHETVYKERVEQDLRKAGVTMGGHTGYIKPVPSEEGYRERRRHDIEGIGQGTTSMVDLQFNNTNNQPFERNPKRQRVMEPSNVRDGGNQSFLNQQGVADDFGDLGAKMDSVNPEQVQQFLRQAGIESFQQLLGATLGEQHQQTTFMNQALTLVHDESSTGLDFAIQQLMQLPGGDACISLIQALASAGPELIKSVANCNPDAIQAVLSQLDPQLLQRLAELNGPQAPPVLRQTLNHKPRGRQRREWQKKRR